ncbi:MAG: hypothetical protein R3C18_25150 [Planctomycetaceae bacterium]
MKNAVVTPPPSTDSNQSIAELVDKRLAYYAKIFGITNVVVFFSAAAYVLFVLPNQAANLATSQAVTQMTSSHKLIDGLAKDAAADIRNAQVSLADLSQEVKVADAKLKSMKAVAELSDEEKSQIVELVRDLQPYSSATDYVKDTERLRQVASRQPVRLTTTRVTFTGATAAQKGDYLLSANPIHLSPPEAPEGYEILGAWLTPLNHKGASTENPLVIYVDSFEGTDVKLKADGPTDSGRFTMHLHVLWARK